MEQPANASEEIRLRRTVRDLVALSTLPAIWIGLGADEIAGSLADVLLNTLSVDLIYVRLVGAGEERVVEVVRTKNRSDPAAVPLVRTAFASLLAADQTESSVTIADPFDGGSLHVTVTRFGSDGVRGILVSGSCRPDFPSERDLALLSVGANQTAIVLQRRRAEEQVQEQREWLRVTLASIGDAVIATDIKGRVTSMNAVAEALTGWSQLDAQGRSLPEVFNIVNEETRQPAENSALRALREGTIVGLANSTILIARDGTERPIDDSAAPIRDKAGAQAGAILVFRDVTKRRRAEMALRQQEAELRDFVENAAVSLHWVAADGTILWANRTEMELLGYSKDEYIGRNIVEFHIDRPVIDEILRGLLCGQEIRGQEARLRCKDGSVKYVLINSSGLWEGGQFLHSRCFTHDITDRKRAEEAMARLAAIVESSQDAIVSKTLDATITSWNRAAERLFGYSAAEAVGQPITLIIPPERLDEEPAILARLRSGERVEHFETVRVAKDGRRLDISLTISPIRDSEGRIIGASKIARDITAKKKLQATLQEQARLLHEVAAAALTIHSAGSLDSVLRVIAEESRRILGAHRGAASLTVGDDCEQAISAVSTSGQHERWRESAIPPPIVSACSEVCRTNRPLRIMRAALASDPVWQAVDDREQYPPLRGWMAAPLISHGGKNLGLIRVADKDDSDFSETDEAILIQLAHIASVAIENARLIGELREQELRKDEFLALLAHELRNPLAPLRNGLEIMRLPEVDAGAVAQARAMMDRQLAHMVRLIDDLLDISRISRNKMELRRSRVVLADVISSAVETARPLVEEADHQLITSLPPEPVILDADLTRLAQLFGNLLANSAKYTPRGGHIWISADRSGHDVVVSVRDDGIGIPTESLGSIFDMFSQVDRSIERSTGGLGIGLALVKGLAEMHGGSVTAESPGVGRGSTFTVRLPVLETGGAIPREAPADEAAGGEVRPRRRILVVDDNRDAAASMVLMLKLLGNDVRTAHDGVEAVEAAEAFRPHVILMDVGMPRLNGYQATRRIREQAWGRSIIVIALTGWGQEADKLQSRDAGCNRHLVKPVSLSDLETLLAEADTFLLHSR